MAEATNFMGYQYHFFKKPSDRQHFLDDHINNGDGNLHVLKSMMHGTVYYAAVKHGNDIFGIIAKTYLSQGELIFELQSEDEGPYYTECPISILKMLTPTENEYAKQWRDNCYEVIKRRKQLQQAQKDCALIRVNLSDGRQIDVRYDDDYGKFMEVESPLHYLSKSAILYNQFEIIDD